MTSEPNWDEALMRQNAYARGYAAIDRGDHTEGPGPAKGRGDDMRDSKLQQLHARLEAHVAEHGDNGILTKRDLLELVDAMTDAPSEQPAVRYVWVLLNEEGEPRSVYSEPTSPIVRGWRVVRARMEEEP